ncbi:MAG: nucleotide exchange factor GrpE [Planctomycetota bacterium]
MNEPTEPNADESRTESASRSQASESGAADLQTLRGERDQLEEQLRRTLADAANMRRRQQKESEDMRRRILEGFTQELLPVLDNFQLALQAWDGQTASKDPAALVQGVRMVQTLLRSALERHGLQEIDAKDQAFDPARHEAVAVESQAGIDAGHVLRVLMPGYLLTDRVLRHAKVVVSGKPAEPQ